jgi:glycosyltransferase involved in cell wall biosynthesis
VIPLAKKYKKKVVVHLHDYQPITYCSAIFGYHSGHYNANFLGDIRRSLKFEIFENKGTGRSILSSLVTPLNKFGRLWLSEADEIICVSKRQCKIIGSVAPELSDRLKVIYNPLPQIPLVEKRLGESNIMYLGGDSYVKGFHIFLRASQEILKQGITVKFLLTRDFKDVNRLYIKRLNKSFKGAYNLLGYLRHEEVLKLHSISHALLFPSIWEEPLPYAVLEAMLSGTIPIASKVGGVPEIVEGSFAEKMLCKPYNVDELADRMESLLAMSNEQIVDVGLSLREAVLNKFDSEAMKKKLIEIFSS